MVPLPTQSELLLQENHSIRLKRKFEKINHQWPT